MPAHFIAQLTNNGGPNPADELANLIRQARDPDSNHFAWFKSTLDNYKNFEFAGSSICILFYRLETGGIEAVIARILNEKIAAPDDAVQFYKGHNNLRAFWQLGGIDKDEGRKSPDIVRKRFKSLEEIPGVSRAGGRPASETFKSQTTAAFWDFPEGSLPNGNTSPLKWLRSFIGDK